MNDRLLWLNSFAIGVVHSFMEGLNLDELFLLQGHSFSILKILQVLKGGNIIRLCMVKWILFGHFSCYF